MNISNKAKILGALTLTISALALPGKAIACSSDAYLASMCAFGGNFAI